MSKCDQDHGINQGNHFYAQFWPINKVIGGPGQEGVIFTIWSYMEDFCLRNSTLFTK